MNNYLAEDIKAFSRTLFNAASCASAELFNSFGNALNIMLKALKGGNKIIVCGNGGSASDAEHMAAELVGRFGYDRPSLPCISLCNPSSTVTAISNDYGYEAVFKRQLLGLGKANDVLVGISTSGKSKNVIEAFKAAREAHILTVAVTGWGDSPLSAIADITIKAPSTATPRIQELHAIIVHSLCRAIESEIFCAEGKNTALPSEKLIDYKSSNAIKSFAKAIKGQKSVFTNGCFDILHPGHITLLSQARAMGEFLIIGLNTDSSIKRLKGEKRPFHNLNNRCLMLSALECVDYIIPFEEDTPENLIRILSPAVLVKGGDYTPKNVVGADWLQTYGGEVKIIPLLEGHSTTKILQSYEK